MADSAAENAINKGDQVSKRKSALETVAPGEEDDSKEHDIKNDFDRSAMLMQSAASGIGREKWGSKMQFLMSCIASAVGLGNVWRFPAICALNGGASFLIPYVVVLLVIARPLFVLELSLGQFSSKGSVRCWDLSPAFTGIGITGMISSVLLSTFYIMLLGWALIYSVVALVSIFYNPTGTPIWSEKTLEFFVFDVIGGLDFKQVGTNYPGSIIPLCHLVLALIFAWMIIWVTMVFGVEASGKFAYVTALAPYFVLFVLLIAGLLLPNMEVGMDYLFNPDWAKLVDANTWFQAVGQCFFSLGIGFGGCIMFSSYNEFHNDIIHDVLIISIVDSITSLLASVSLMSILGFQAALAYDRLWNAFTTEPPDDDTIKAFNKLLECAKVPKPKNGTIPPDDDVFALRKCALKDMVGEQGGAGLAFIHYPAAMNEINKQWGAPVGTFLGLLFFLMLILLAVGSANGFVGTTVISDKKPKWKRSNIVSGVCLISCLSGMIYTNKFGTGWFDVVDYHGVTAVVYVLALMEVVAVVYVYGLKNMCDDIEFMRNGKPPGWYLRITWVTLPLLMVVIYIYWLVTYKIPNNWTTPVVVIAWLITVCCLLTIPATMIYKFFEFKKNPWRRNIRFTPCNMLCAIFSPSPRWGPRDPVIRVCWKEFKAGRRPYYEITARIMAFGYRMFGKPEPVVRPTLSYATAAFSTAPDSQQSTAPQSGMGSPDQIKSKNSMVVSETPSNV